MDLFQNLQLGFSVALQPTNILFCLIGAAASMFRGGRYYDAEEGRPEPPHPATARLRQHASTRREEQHAS